MRTCSNPETISRTSGSWRIISRVAARMEASYPPLTDWPAAPSKRAANASNVRVWIAEVAAEESNAATRSRSSATATRVKLKTRTRDGTTSPRATSEAIRAHATKVFPEPGPASTTNRALAGASMTRCCCGSGPAASTELSNSCCTPSQSLMKLAFTSLMDHAVVAGSKSPHSASARDSSFGIAVASVHVPADATSRSIFGGGASSISCKYSNKLWVEGEAASGKRPAPSSDIGIP